MSNFHSLGNRYMRPEVEIFIAICLIERLSLDFRNAVATSRLTFKRVDIINLSREDCPWQLSY
jgi:hypothetical protein